MDIGKFLPISAESADWWKVHWDYSLHQSTIYRSPLVTFTFTEASYKYGEPS